MITNPIMTTNEDKPSRQEIIEFLSSAILHAEAHSAELRRDQDEAKETDNVNLEFNATVELVVVTSSKNASIRAWQFVTGQTWEPGL